jgi:hypothetical protein
METVNVAFDWQTQSRRKDGCRGACLLMKKFPECKNKNESACWVNRFTDKQTTAAGCICISKDMLVEFCTFIVRKAFFTYGKSVWHIRRGFPTGTNAAPEMANLYLLSYEMSFFERQTRMWNTLTIERKMFILGYRRFIDDVFHLDGVDEPTSCLYKTEDQDGIFPTVLIDNGSIIDMPLKLSGDSSKEINFLDVTVTIETATKSRLTYKLYDKREFMTVAGQKVSSLPTYPNIDSNLAESCKYGVVTSQLHRFARRNMRASSVEENIIKLCQKMITHGYDKDSIVAQLQRFRDWPKTLGPWQKSLRRILNKLNL